MKPKYIGWWWYSFYQGVRSCDEITWKQSNRGRDRRHDWCRKPFFQKASKSCLLECQDADADGSGSVDFTEFVELMIKRESEKETPEDLKQAFRVFDKVC